MKRLSPIRILRVFRPAPYLCALPRNGSPFPPSLTTFFTTLFRNSQLPRSYSHVSRSAAQPRHSSTPLLPTIEFCIGPASAAIAGGFLQVVVSKAREPTVLMQGP